jgi:hypothetical protein
MPEPTNDRKPKSWVLALAVLGIGCVLVAGLVFGALKQSQLNHQRQDAERLQREFVRVKQGDSQPLVMESKLLPMLAADAECRQIIRGIDFSMVAIDPMDAKAVSRLQNVTSMTFYCTEGTREVLLASASLPITDLYFEMPDLSSEDYLLLKDFPQLKKVRFEHIMEDEWIERLKTELPNVIVEAPFPRSENP